MNNKVFVEYADVIDYTCDVLILKYAQEFYGADALVASIIHPTAEDRPHLSPPPGKYVLLSSEGKIAARKILFVGVLHLSQFDYGRIREFANYSMQILAGQVPEAKHIAMTMHGVGYGLDERESFLAQVAGLLDSFRSAIILPALERVTIVERNKGRAERLQQILDEFLPSAPSSIDSYKAHTPSSTIQEINAGPQSNKKPHIFVAMPISDDTEDVYNWGIQGPVNTAGYLCERVDRAIFTGDILDRIKSKIDTAKLVIADLTGANPNVYLEVGYAWGKNKPTLLLSKKADELKFDVRGQRCIVYKNITDLAKKLEADLKLLSEQL